MMQVRVTREYHGEEGKTKRGQILIVAPKRAGYLLRKGLVTEVNATVPLTRGPTGAETSPPSSPAAPARRGRRSRQVEAE